MNVFLVKQIDLLAENCRDICLGTCPTDGCRICNRDGQGRLENVEKGLFPEVDIVNSTEDGLSFIHTEFLPLISNELQGGSDRNIHNCVTRISCKEILSNTRFGQCDILAINEDRLTTHNLLGKAPPKGRPATSKTARKTG